MLEIQGDHSFIIQSAPAAQKDFPICCAVDGDAFTAYKVARKASHYSIVCELPSVQTIYGFRYFPLIDDPSGRIKLWKVYTSFDGKEWSKEIVASGAFNARYFEFWPYPEEHYPPVLFSLPIRAKYIKLDIPETSDGSLTIADLNWITDISNPEMMAQSFALLKGKRMAPSVHLRYDLPEANMFYNELRILKSTPGSYFMACGFAGGYFGLQELENRKKVLIFSVWDLKEDHDIDALPESERTRCEYCHPSVRVARFGGEGTGGQSFMSFDWKIGEKYRFAVSCEPFGKKRTSYTAWFWMPDTKTWRKLITFSSPLQKKRKLSSFYSFVEDFRRDYRSFNQTRKAQFSNTQVLVNKKPIPCKAMCFTKDINPNMNVDCWVDVEGVTIASGGKLTNVHRPLFQPFEISWAHTPPIDFIKNF